MAQTIAIEVRKLIDAACEEAQRILTEYREQLETVAQGLLQYESLSGQEIRNLLAGKPPVRDWGDEPAPEAILAPAGKEARTESTEPELTPRLQA